MAKNIIGIKVTIAKKEKVLEEVKKYLKNHTLAKEKSPKNEIKPLVIFTPNPEIMAYAQKNDLFKQIVNSAQINIPDGQGVVWAAKKLFGIEFEKISGVDLMQELSFLSAKEGLTVGLIGGRVGVALLTAECLRKKYPGLRIEVLGEPKVEITNETQTNERYFSSLRNKINEKQIDILFVALGFPKQEMFIERIKKQELRSKKKRPLVLMAVGGAFDYISGRVKRAPVWMRKNGLEWLYRLISEPSRLVRHIKGSLFFWQVLSSS